MIKRATVALLLICCLLFSLPAGAQMQKFSTYFMDSFDTVTTLIGYCEDQETFDMWAQAAHDMMLYLHKLYDKYNSYEDEGIVNIHTLNQRAAKEPVKVDDLLFSLLSFSKAGRLGLVGEGNGDFKRKCVARLHPAFTRTLVLVVKGKLPHAVEIEERVADKIGSGMLRTGDRVKLFAAHGNVLLINTNNL